MTVTANAPEISAADSRTAHFFCSGLRLNARCGMNMHCAVCDKGFSPKHPRGRFCSSRCRLAAWQQRRAQKYAERDATIRLKLQEVQRSAAEALALLVDEGTPLAQD